MKKISISANTVAEGLFEWCSVHQQWFRGPIEQADPTQEANARAGLCLVGRGSFDEFSKLPEGAQQLARRLFVDFFGKIMGPLAHKEWTIEVPLDAVDAMALAWRVVEFEINRAQEASLPH